MCYGWGGPAQGTLGEQLEMDDVEVGRRVTNLAAVLARMYGKVGERDLDALQECLRLAESVPGLQEGLLQVRLAEAAAREALRKYGRHGDGCGGSRGCTCGPESALDADAGPDLLAYLVLLRALASAVRRCGVPVPEGLWAAAGKVARWEAAHRGLLRLLEQIVEPSACAPTRGRADDPRTHLFREDAAGRRVPPAFFRLYPVASRGRRPRP
jgi:hypothetical protein